MAAMRLRHGTLLGVPHVALPVALPGLMPIAIRVRPPDHHQLYFVNHQSFRYTCRILSGTSVHSYSIAVPCDCVYLVLIPYMVYFAVLARHKFSARLRASYKISILHMPCTAMLLKPYTCQL